MLKISDEIRFWKYVQKTENCWIWIGNKFPNKYGQFSIKSYPVLAHRFSYELAYGEISSPDLFVCHKCDNNPCVNPEHLFLGTQKENIQDMISKGRINRKGNNSHCHILAEEDVISIRKRYNNGNGESVLDIFKDYKHLIATRETIRTICLNLAWKSVYV